MSMGEKSRNLSDRTFTISAGDRVVTLPAKTIRHALSSALQRYGSAFADEKIDSVHVVRTAPKD